MAKLPWQVGIGNHERDYPNSGSVYTFSNDSGGECGVPYSSRFDMPNKGYWYSFEAGPVHFTIMSTEHDFCEGSEQYKWIEADLASVNRSRTPWLVFGGHRPMYIDSTNDHGAPFPEGSSDVGVAVALRKCLEELLVRYKVDVAYWGHHHSYQRTCPVRNSVCTAGSPVHLVVGNAGQSLSTNVAATRPPFFEYVNDHEYGHSRLQANRTTFVATMVLNVDGRTLDQLVLRR